MKNSTYHSTYKKLKHYKPGAMNELYTLLDNMEYYEVLALIEHMARAVSIDFMKECIIFHLLKRSNIYHKHRELVIDMLCYYLILLHWNNYKFPVEAILYFQPVELIHSNSEIYHIRETMFHNFNIIKYDYEADKLFI